MKRLLLFSLLITLGSTWLTAQVIPTRTTGSSTSNETAKVWVWSIQGQATYQEAGMDMARPLMEGQQLTTKANVWVSDGGEVYLMRNGESKQLGSGTHSLKTWATTSTEPTGWVAPNPDPSYNPARLDLYGSGFGQGLTPPPTDGRSGNDGSGFGQGLTPPPTDGRSGNDGSGFGQGLTPPPTDGRSGNDGSGFGDGLTPPPTDGRSGNDGSGFGDGLTPPPDLGTRDQDSRSSGGSGSVETGQKMAFKGVFGGQVTAGPVYYRWTHPGKQACQFRLAKTGSSQPPFFQINTLSGGMTVDLRDLGLNSGETYIASVSIPENESAGKAQVTFQVVDVSVQTKVLANAEQNKLYRPANAGHRLLLKAMELEKAKLLSAASTHYQKAIDLNPESELVRAMVYTFKEKYQLN